MFTSDSGKTFIKNEEGYSPTPYDDAGGKSIGYGHFIKPGEEALLNGITRAKADELFDEDVKAFEACVNRGVTVRLSQNEFDALVSFTYNVGCAAFTKSTLLKMLNQNRREEAACQFLRWIYSQGLVVPALQRRRLKEQALFYGSNPPCAGVQTDIPGSIVEKTPDRPETPLQCPAYPEKRLPGWILEEIKFAEDVQKETGKLPQKAGYGIQRLGDRNTGLGTITTVKDAKVTANGLPVATDGDLVTGDPPKHPAQTANGSRKVYVNGKRVNYRTNPDTNLLTRIGGSKNVFLR